jgi:disulfide bond formation protein DsbB
MLGGLLTIPRLALVAFLLVTVLVAGVALTADSGDEWRSP